MFRRKPIHERLAEAVIKELKHSSLIGASGLDPGRVASWSVSTDADGRVEILLAIQQRPHRIQSHTIEMEPQDG